MRQGDLAIIANLRNSHFSSQPSLHACLTQSRSSRYKLQIKYKCTKGYTEFLSYFNGFHWLQLFFSISSSPTPRPTVFSVSPVSLLSSKWMDEHEIKIQPFNLVCDIPPKSKLRASAKILSVYVQFEKITAFLL